MRAVGDAAGEDDDRGRGHRGERRRLRGEGRPPTRDALPKTIRKPNRIQVRS